MNDIASRRFVLFVGAGASKWSTPSGGGSFRDWKEFLVFANKSVVDGRVQRLIGKMIRAGDFLVASELLRQNLDAQWESLLTNEFQQAADVSRLHKALIQLRPRLILTTNFDKLIENAWAAGGVERHPVVISEVKADAFKLFRDDENYLLKIHGTVDLPGAIVFDKSGYQKGAFANNYYQELLSTLLLTHTFIFVGFSMQDPAITMIVENAAYRFPGNRPHYIFQAGSPIREIDDLWKRLRKLFVIRYPAANGHVALAEKIEVLVAEVDRRRGELAAMGRLPQYRSD